MAKLFRCWVIVTGNAPTAFRARDREDLLPTLHQLQRTQPDAVLMWFERGRLWTSREEAANARRSRRPRDQSRGPEWRPGGEHRDPRARPKLPRDRRRELYRKRLIAKKTKAAATGHGSPAPPRDTERRPKATPKSKPAATGPARRRTGGPGGRKPRRNNES
ncbi:MAG: hypothetical protein DIU54_006385 [Acidobacteriota bacterium]|jgi:hypothetical protein|nr:MAG: hypothetical protein DIU54_07635 [Acidobacteriota bacterium]